jgi:hypothetical protein
MRRIGRQRGPITRRVAAQGGVRSATLTWVAQLNTGSAIFVGQPWVDLASFNVVRQRIAQPTTIRSYTEVTQPLVANTLGRPTYQIAPEGKPVTVPPIQKFPIPADSQTARNFRAAAGAHLTRINPGRMGFLTAPPPPLAFKGVRDNLLAQIEPKRTLVMLARAVISTGANATQPTNTTANAVVPIEPVMAAPKFAQPMYEPLRDLSQELLLPGLDAVPPNTVLGLQTNRRFVQAYMVGLNFEMGRELLWRGYPTDQRGTCFDQFWDTRGADKSVADVIALHTWGTRPLGDAQLTPAGEQFVMLLRSDLLRRYPTAVIYATPAVMNNGVRTPSTDPAAEVPPAFRGSLQPDVSFFGFNLAIKTVVGGSGGQLGYFIVIQEQPTEPRFGLDVGTPTGNATHLRVSPAPPAGLPLNGLQWGRNAAHMAGITRQMPVRIAVHASQFIPQT